MALRNLNFDQAIRGIANSAADFSPLLDACNAKMKQLKLKADPGKAVGKAPRHAGRRNPQRGQFIGSGDVNFRSLIDWVESIEPLPVKPGTKPDASADKALAKPPTKPIVAPASSTVLGAKPVVTVPSVPAKAVLRTAPLPLDVPAIGSKAEDEAFKAELALMQTAHDQLIQIHATLVAHAK